MTKITVWRQPAGRRVRSAGRGRRGFEIAPWLYLLPVLVTLVVWTYLPLAEAFRLSFYQWNMLPTSPQRYVGLDNYMRLFKLPEMRRALWNTLIYIVGLFPMSVFIPLIVAILTQDLTGRLRNLYRALIFVPMIIAPVIAGVVWRWLLNVDHGLVNRGVEAIGLSPIGFLQDADWALPTLIWITGWKLIGFSTLLISAANANINPSYIEAARIDGASRWRIICDIRLPLLSPVILMLSMMTVLLGAQWSFTYISVLTGGGPLKSTTNIFYLLYEYGFSSMTVGWSAAAGMITFAGFTVIALVCLAIMRKRAFYDN